MVRRHKKQRETIVRPHRPTFLMRSRPVSAETGLMSVDPSRVDELHKERIFSSDLIRLGDVELVGSKGEVSLLRVICSGTKRACLESRREHSRAVFPARLRLLLVDAIETNVSASEWYDRRTDAS